MTIKPDIQLIGLDSIVDDDWGGLIASTQLGWLKNELETHAGKLVILAVHHPLHELAPIDRQNGWRRFVCDNGPEVMALLDNYPQVKLVLTAHHHLTKADRFARRLHLACPAMPVYPCAYRTVRLRRQSGGRWEISWQTHAAADQASIAKARELMVTSWRDRVGLDPDFVAAYVRLALGSAADRAGQLVS